MQSETRWYHFLAYFFGGAFLANAIPHLVSGISGSPFQSPFARPPGEGLSSSTVNVLWGSFNLVVAYLLVVRVGRFDLRQTKHVVDSRTGGVTHGTDAGTRFRKIPWGKSLRKRSRVFNPASPGSHQPMKPLAFGERPIRGEHAGFPGVRFHAFECTVKVRLAKSWGPRS